MAPAVLGELHNVGHPAAPWAELILNDGDQVMGIEPGDTTRADYAQDRGPSRIARVLRQLPLKPRGSGVWRGSRPDGDELADRDRSVVLMALIDPRRQDAHSL